MQSLTFYTHVGKDGILKLETPIGIKDAEVEVILVVNPASKTHQTKAIREAKGWPLGFFDATFGSIPDLLERAPQGDFEFRESIE